MARMIAEVYDALRSAGADDDKARAAATAVAESDRDITDLRLEPARTAHDLTRTFQDLERRLRAAEARVTSSEFKLRRQFKDREG